MTYPIVLSICKVKKLIASVYLLANIAPRGRGTPNSGLYGEAPPERGAFFELAVYKRVGKIVILVYERDTKSAAKWNGG